MAARTSSNSPSSRGTKELSLANNSAIALVNGVRDRLKVLLISGEPHAGERAWRSLLKSDPSVDLVHFTILRPPEKQDGTPINELSLIAFPVRELFELQAQGLRPRHLRPLPARGRAAAGLFRQYRQLRRAGRRAAGFGGPRLLHAPTASIARRSAGVLPAEPTGDVLEQGFRPGADAAGPAPSRHLRPAGQRARRPGADLGPLVPPDRCHSPSGRLGHERRRRPAAAGAEQGRQGPHGRDPER